MFWLILLAAFLLAVPSSYALARRIPDQRSWSRVLKAAAIAPGPIILLVVIGSLWAMATLPEDGENGAGITRFLLVLFGMPLAASTLAGGLVGALASQRARRL
jgi:hypothetical protein